jgi:hypothetical protein
VTRALFIAFGIAVIGAFVFGYGKGHGAASAACQAERLAEELEAARLDLEYERAMRQLEQRQNRDLAAQARERQERVDALERELAASPPPAVCRATRADVERLRSIKGPPPKPPIGP